MPVRCEDGSDSAEGVKDFVMAWTLCLFFIFFRMRREADEAGGEVLTHGMSLLGRGSHLH